ncbi:MAG: carboxypeptidase-like regulatory domain-containing protein [Lentimicrobiaceae bacterium]|nr:carboxypeptidase-like regulatory domain-containing protein [Lentimicrobiaceae bacterium]
MKKMLAFASFLILMLLASNSSFAQGRGKVIQFSGIIVDSDSLKPIPFTHISVKNSYRGTTSDYYGFFSIVVRHYDTLVFSAVGYKKVNYTIPDTLSVNRYSVIQVMTRDTITLAPTVIYPWPTKEQFKNTFLTKEIPLDDIEIAKRNIAVMEMKESVGRNYDPQKFGYTAQQSYTHHMNTFADQLYYKGQLMPNNLLNPIAWAKFIKAWKNGEFKRKK